MIAEDYSLLLIYFLIYKKQGFPLLDALFLSRSEVDARHFWLD